MKVFPVGAVFSGYGNYGGDSTYFRKYSLMRNNHYAEPFWPKNPVDSLRYIGSSHFFPVKLKNG